ncbi:MAG: hypothetical protein Q4G40_11935, partial [Brachybacterium sp.]|nr:hypothetical protein [Brachybacterium sp.]
AGQVLRRIGRPFPWVGLEALGASLPLTAPPSVRTLALEQTIPLAEVESANLDVLSGLHVTTCTGINGSREAGRAWCTEEDVDEDGTDFDVIVQADLLAADGSVCDSLAATQETIDLDKWRHHQLIPLELPVELPGSPCGDTARVSIAIDNRGPASLVVHESNTALVTLAA